MILSTVSSGLQVGSQSNVQPQTQIGANTQQLFVFVFGNNNVVTVDQANLMPFLNLNWVNQTMGQTQVAGDVTSTSNSGNLQWEPGSLTSLMGQVAPALGASPAPSPSPTPPASPMPTATPVVPCGGPYPTPTPVPAVSASPTASPTPTPTPTPTASPAIGESDAAALAAALTSLAASPLPIP
jgi:hypothetical protein